MEGRCEGWLEWWIKRGGRVIGRDGGVIYCRGGVREWVVAVVACGMLASLHLKRGLVMFDMEDRAGTPWLSLMLLVCICSISVPEQFLERSRAVLRLCYFGRPIFSAETGEW